MERVFIAIMYLSDRSVTLIGNIPGRRKNGDLLLPGDVIEDKRTPGAPFESAVILGVGDSAAAAKKDSQQYYNEVAALHKKEDGATQFWDYDDDSDTWEELECELRG